MPLLFLFVAVPVLEIYLLIKVGSAIGALPTIGLVLLTAALGAALLRQQGLATLTRYQQRLARGEIPAQEMMEGLALAFGGALLLTPGFFTDFVGLLCLLPWTRRWVIRWLLARLHVRILRGGPPGGGPGGPAGPAAGGGNVYEGEFTRAPRDDERRLP